MRERAECAFARGGVYVQQKRQSRQLGSSIAHLLAQVIRLLLGVHTISHVAKTMA
jgi:hypothetical protein